ncbi:TVP38/TMEM64 family protein [Prauserella halophila]|uniref:TVP38/TMEM64 family membrane protein n=1 Tax=Prauserella halophila TaxID=185641 RepID=A0ABP4GHK2_9PSEU|nr:TVP38/TMEM64 family protein [Prauserella halophila]MCP2234255.1 putative membrane protein YdjX, TVP38/TMEM64 family, SNARE-associated domain [Prauserella halophila]
MPRRTTLLLGILLLAALVLAALLLPIPSPAEMRAWADEAGAAASVVFLAAYAVCTIAPVPRTAFNLAAGLLLGHVSGVVVALTATIVSGLCGFQLARLLGREFVTRNLHRTSVHAVDARLSGGGMLAVASLRLIPVVPFAPLSYCCGVSSLALRPYLVGTALGSVPGTIAVVVLGDALTGNTPTALLICYGVFAALGAAGLLRVIRTAAPAGDRMAGVASRPDGAAD